MNQMAVPDEPMRSNRNPFRRESTAPRTRGIAAGVLSAALLVAASMGMPAHAQKAPSPMLPTLQKGAEKPDAAPADDHLGRTSPFGTVLGFINAVEREDLNRSTEYLDTQQLPKQSRKLAQELAAVLDAADLQDLSRKPEGNTEDGLEPNRVEKLAAALALDPEPSNLLFLLGDRNRLGYLAAIVDTFRDLADQHLGRLRATVTSAVKLDDLAAQAIAEKLSQATKAKVLLDRVVDPALLGGVVAQVGSLVYDGSVRSQLEDLRKQLKQ